MGRSRERQRLDDAMPGIRGGEGAVLVLRGDAGVDTPALLRYAAGRARGAGHARPPVGESGGFLRGGRTFVQVRAGFGPSVYMP